MARDIHGFEIGEGGMTPPGYVQPTQPRKLRSTSTSTTAGEVTPEKFQQYWQAAYGGVPMGVDIGQLGDIWQENVIGPGMEAGRRAAARNTGLSGAAPGAGNEAWQQRQLAGKYGAGLAGLQSQALSQGVQNQLQSRGILAALMGRGSTTTSETLSDDPTDRSGQFGGFKMSQPSGTPSMMAPYLKQISEQAAPTGSWWDTEQGKKASTQSISGNWWNPQESNIYRGAGFGEGGA